jgi:PEP-CTERM motif
MISDLEGPFIPSDLILGFQFDSSGDIGVVDIASNNGPLLGTPVPATLPLFATGLGAMGLLGWRRKRKAQAAA